MSASRLALILLAALAPLAGAGDKRPRLAEEKPPGRREKLSLGTLFLPEKLPPRGKVPLFLHFHGPGWIAEVAAARGGARTGRGDEVPLGSRGDLAVLHAQLGSGSAVYGRPFQDTKRLRELLAEAGKKSGRELELVGLTGWSAGYGAVRAILRVEEYYRRVRWVVLMDGLHAGYTADKKPIEADLDCYVRLAKDAAAGRKRFLLTHTRIVPGRYASTTETADYLLDKVGLKREKKAARPLGLPQETEARRGGLRVLGCAGATAADHIDHLHVLPGLLGLVLKDKD
jgi:hypothetical protein